jgi:hypothetical protein
MFVLFSLLRVDVSRAEDAQGPTEQETIGFVVQTLGIPNRVCLGTENF